MCALFSISNTWAQSAGALQKSIGISCWVALLPEAWNVESCLKRATSPFTGPVWIQIQMHLHLYKVPQAQKVRKSLTWFLFVMKQIKCAQLSYMTPILIPNPKRWPTLYRLGHLWGGIFGSAIKEHKQQLTVLGINPLFPVLNISASCLNEYCGVFLFFF